MRRMKGRRERREEMLRRVDNAELTWGDEVEGETCGDEVEGEGDEGRRDVGRDGMSVKRKRKTKEGKGANEGNKK